jgi:hypothetical protein
MIKDLILGTAIGYDWQDIKIFIKSLRNFNKCEVYLLVNEVNDKTKIKLKKYNIKIIKCNLEPLEFRFRYIYFSQFLKKNYKKFRYVFFTDVRDVFFQGNPFSNKIRNIEFFEEDNIIKNCKINSLWIKSSLGPKKYENYKNKNIVCSGTVIGKSFVILKYFQLMSKKVNKLKMKFSFKDFFLIRQIKYGLDQPACHDIVYSNIFKKQKIHSNIYGYIATVGHMKKLLFSRKGELINFKNKKYHVVHQYDRFINKFKKFIVRYS